MKKNLLLIMAIFFLTRLGYAQQLPVQTEEKISQYGATKGKWDVLYTYNFNADYPNTVAAFYWDGKVYTARSGSSFGELNCFKISGNTLIFESSFTVPGVTGANFAGFTTDGTYIYAVNARNALIYKINPETWTFTTIPVPATTYSAIAFDKESGGFWVAANRASTVVLLTSTGASAGKMLSTTPADPNITGLAYDDVTQGGPYLMTAMGALNANNKAILGRWNIADITDVSKVPYEPDIKNVAALPEGVASGNYMGGIFTYKTNTKLCLVGISRGAGLVFGYELADLNLAAVGAPAAVTDLSITPDATGNLTAVLNWTNPTKTKDGDALTELTAINIYEDNKTDPSYIVSNPNIGCAGNYTVSVSSAGMYSYKVVAENSSGEGIPASSNSVWIGPDVPAAPSNVKLENNDMTANLSWDAPITGLHSGYFSEEGIVYDVFRSPGNVKVSSNQTTTTFSELITQSNSYSYKIVAKNAIGEGGSANSTLVPFCIAISTFSWKEGFENESSIPACWSIYDEDGGNPIWNVFTSPTALIHSGARAMRHTAGSYQTGWLITPEIKIPATGYMLEFWSVNDASNSSDCSVWVSTTNNENSSFTMEKQLTGSELSTSYQKISIPLNNFSGKNIYIGFRYSSGSLSAGWAIDDVEIFYSGVVTTCAAPKNVTIPTATITISQAVVNWTAGSTENEWSVEYKAENETNWTRKSASSPSITLTGLIADTKYNVRIRAICGEDDTSAYSSSVSFRTSVCEIPLFFTPSSNGITESQASFLWVQGGSETAWSVEYKPETETVWLKRITSATSITLTDLIANTKYNVCIRAICGAGDTSACLTGSFTTKPASTVSCNIPTNLTVPTTTITTSQAVVNWTAGGTETSWSVEYKTKNETTWTKTDNVNNTPTITLTGLNANTEYCVHVKAICGADDESDFTQEVCFTTLPLTNPTYYTITATSSSNGTISPLGDTVVLAGASVTFTFTPDEGYAIEALFVDDNNIELTGYTYTFSNVDANHTIHVDFVIVGVKEHALENVLLLYPNPTTGELKIKNWELKINNVEIFDLTGKILFTVHDSLFTNSIDISHLPAGVYFVRLNTETGFLTKKLIKE